jgi:hypothetical protein
MVAAMSRIAQIACVVIFIALMVAIHQGFLSLQNWFSGDFPVGFGVGVIFTLGLVFLYPEVRNRKKYGQRSIRN